MYTVEFQKRGLPHAHILIWLSSVNKLKIGTHIDKIISAELPDSTLYPKLSKAVTSYMIHGPCGSINVNSPCMKNGRCSKYYPKSLQASTTIDEDGYPKYKRRDTGVLTEKCGGKLDNGYVVPYNPHLIMRYGGHVNVEYCNKSNSIKYLFKYVNKGPDRATIGVSNCPNGGDKDKPVDEIQQYYDCRYVSPPEAVWRIFAFDIHEKWPPVLKMAFHLPNEQSVLYRDYESTQRVVDRGQVQRTMFLAWFEANRMYLGGRDLTYSEFPKRFVYYKDEKRWKPRQAGDQIGRLQYTPPGVGDLYYMRLLLTRQRGCMSYKCLRTVNGITYDTYKEACYALELLADDKEFIDAIVEASEMYSGHQLRCLFVYLICMC
jgi:hypothetical protein